MKAKPKPKQPARWGYDPHMPGGNHSLKPDRTPPRPSKRAMKVDPMKPKGPWEHFGR